MKTKNILIVIVSILALGGLQAQSGPATPATAPAATSAAAPAPAAAATPAAPAAAAPVAAATPAAPATPAASKEPPLTVEIKVNDTPAFSVTKIEAHPGQTVTVRLVDTGSLPKNAMGHNWILLKANADVNAYAMAAAAAKADNFEPKALADQVVASIPMVGAKQTGEVTFTCPTSPGTYHYLCSCYGHSLMGMKGTLVVK